MVKVNGVKMSKGKKRKLVGTTNERCWRDKFYRPAIIRSYRWREL